MKTYYASIPAKNADDALTALHTLEQECRGSEEIEVRQIIPMGQKALVIYLIYEQGVVR